jgi:hypothetical protein
VADFAGKILQAKLLWIQAKLSRHVPEDEHCRLKEPQWVFYTRINPAASVGFFGRLEWRVGLRRSTAVSNFGPVTLV